MRYRQNYRTKIKPLVMVYLLSDVIGYQQQSSTSIYIYKSSLLFFILHLHVQSPQFFMVSIVVMIIKFYPGIIMTTTAARFIPNKYSSKNNCSSLRLLLVLIVNLTNAQIYLIRQSANHLKSL